MRRNIALTEIFVGVGFAVLLMSIVFPVYTNAREKTRQESCFANLSALARGIQNYCEDYDDYLPGAYLPVCGYWYERLDPYLHGAGGRVDAEVFHCPAWPGGFVFDPPLRFHGEEPVGYGYNECLRAVDDLGGLKRADVERPSAIILLGDSGPTWCEETQAWKTGAGIIGCGNCNAMHLIQPEKRKSEYPVYTRHHGYGNVAFVDGHVALVEQAFLADPSHF